MNTYTVIYRETGPEWLYFVCEADDPLHSEGQFADAYPECADLIVGVYEASSPDEALKQMAKEKGWTSWIRTQDLTGAALDWAVSSVLFPESDYRNECQFSPSTDWSQGGPIIAQEGIVVSSSMHPSAPWFAMFNSAGFKSSGPTPLIAAMRCYVASRLGWEIEVPDEFIED